jgi:hypothetical protein
MASKFTGKVQSVSGYVGDIDTSQRNTLGAIVTMDDGNEYIYLKGVASTLVDDVVTFNATTYQTVRIVADAVGSVAIASAAILGANWGWYLILGFGTANSDTVAAAGGLFIDGTAGRVDDASVAGDFVNGMVSTAADTANKLPVHLTSYPYVTNTVPA